MQVPPPTSYIRVNDLRCPDGTGIGVGSKRGDGPSAARSDLTEIGASWEIAATVIDALAKAGLHSATDEGPRRWTPVKETERILSRRPVRPPGSWQHAHDDEVLVWHGSFNHGGYGCDVPVVKARGLVRASPRELLDLLLDSGRVREYNKMSLGRRDEHHFVRWGEDGRKGEAKIVRSLTKPSVIRKPIEMLLLLHARRLDGDSDAVATGAGGGQVRGYLVVTRSVWERESLAPLSRDQKAANANEKAIRSEMLLGVNLIQKLEGQPDCCELTTITHLSSLYMPLMIAKKIGLTVSWIYRRSHLFGVALSFVL